MTAPRIMIVEDDVEIAAFLAAGLTAEGYEIVVSRDGHDLPAQVRDGGFDAVILDRMLPDVEGAELCRRVRAAGENVMILMLTAKDALDDKLEGLRAGADDYMTKPFAFEELLARLDVLRRHAAGNRPASDEIVAGDIRIDLSLKTAQRSGQELNLTATEFALLRHFAANAGRVISKTDLLQSVWGYDFDPHTNIVEVYVAYLRKKLDRAGEPGILQTVRGFGYLLAADG